MTVQPSDFGDTDGDAADAGTAGVHQDHLAGFQAGIVEQHVLDGGIGDGDAGGVVQFHAVGDLHGQPGRVVGEFLGEAVDMEAAHAGGVFAQILAAGAAGLQVPQTSAA